VATIDKRKKLAYNVDIRLCLKKSIDKHTSLLDIALWLQWINEKTPDKYADISRYLTNTLAYYIVI
jgi:hypothetical protein